MSVKDCKQFSEKLEEIKSMLENIDRCKLEKEKIAPRLKTKDLYQKVYNAELKALTEEFEKNHKMPKEPKPSFLYGWLINMIRAHKYGKKLEAYVEMRSQAIKEFETQAKEKATEAANRASIENKPLADKFLKTRQMIADLSRDVSTLFDELDFPENYRSLPYVNRLLPILAASDLSLEETLKQAYESFRPAEEVAAEKAEMRFLELLASGKADDLSAHDAANEGSGSAAFYLGEKWFNQHCDATFGRTFLTNNELKSLYRLSSRYLRQAINEGFEQAEILYVALQINANEINYKECKQLLYRLRSIQASGKHPEYNEMILSCNKALVTIINELDDDGNIKTGGKHSCRYCDHGICRYYTTNYYTAHCEYYEDPGKCATALAQNSITYES